MSSLVGLVTYALLVDHTAKRYSVDLRHVARLDDGQEVPLLDDRGFTGTFVGGRSDPSTHVGTREQIELDARTCVGPDEPVGLETSEQMVTSHYAFLAKRLRAAGVRTTVEELNGLSHDVVLDERLEDAVAHDENRRRSRRR